MSTLDIYTQATEEDIESQYVEARWIHVPHCGRCGRAIMNPDLATTNVIICSSKKCGAINRFAPGAVLMPSRV